MTSRGSCSSQPSQACSNGVIQLSHSPEALRQLALTELQPATQPSVGPGSGCRQPLGVAMAQSRSCESSQAPFNPSALPRVTELPFFSEETAEVEALVRELEAATEAFGEGRRQLRSLLRRRAHLEAQFQRAAEASRASAEAVEGAMEDARRWLHVGFPCFLAEGLEHGEQGNTPALDGPKTGSLEALRHKSAQQAAELQRLAQRCATLQQADQAADIAKLNSLQMQNLKEQVSHQDQLRDLRARRAELLRSLGGTSDRAKKSTRARLHSIGVVIVPLK